MLDCIVLETLCLTPKSRHLEIGCWAALDVTFMGLGEKSLPHVRTSLLGELVLTLLSQLENASG